MTRSEAVEKLVAGKHCNSAQAAYEVDALVILGVIKLDEPKPLRDRVWSALYENGLVNNYVSPNNIEIALGNVGLKIVEK